MQKPMSLGDVAKQQSRRVCMSKFRRLTCMNSAPSSSERETIRCAECGCVRLSRSRASNVTFAPLLLKSPPPTIRHACTDTQHIRFITRHILLFSATV